jgi:hypothetical protein
MLLIFILLVFNASLNKLEITISIRTHIFLMFSNQWPAQLAVRQ